MEKMNLLTKIIKAEQDAHSLGLSQDDLITMKEIIKARSKEDLDNIIQSKETGNPLADIMIVGKVVDLAKNVESAVKYMKSKGKTDNKVSVGQILSTLVEMSNNEKEDDNNCNDGEQIKDLLEKFFEKIMSDEEECNCEECNCCDCEEERENEEIETRHFDDFSCLYSQRFMFGDMIAILEDGIVLNQTDTDYVVNIDPNKVQFVFKSVTTGIDYSLLNGKLFETKNGKISAAAFTINMLDDEYKFSEQTVKSITSVSSEELREKDRSSVVGTIAGHEALARVNSGEKMHFEVEMFGRLYTGFLEMKNNIPSYAIDNIKDILGSAEGIILGALMSGKWTAK